MSIEEKYLVVERGGATYFGELGHGFKPPISIHIPRWCVMDRPVQWYVELDILGVLLGLVHNDGRNEAFTISLVSLGWSLIGSPSFSKKGWVFLQLVCLSAHSLK